MRRKCGNPSQKPSKNGETSVLKIIDVIIGLKVTTEEEVQGLDITQHSEIGILCNWPTRTDGKCTAYTVRSHLPD